jgi:hypothetical protein
VKGGLPAALRNCSDILLCPVSGAPLIATEDGYATADGARSYPVEDGIARFFAPTDPQSRTGDVTDLVKAFYEETPFPNYAKGETRVSLAAKARANHFLRALDEAVPAGAVVLEAGCGTGQLANFLGLAEGQETPQLRAWFRDQYRHPHETRHSISEVLRWCDESSVDFLGTLPRTDGASIAAAPLFAPQARRTPARYLALELGLLLRGSHDGGLFILLGRKRG